jgi:hypothetical protein
MANSSMKARLKKLETQLDRQRRILEASRVPELERSDEEWADWVGDFLWWPKGAEMAHWPRFSNSATPTNEPLRAWYQAAEQAFQQGHRDYHVGLRPFAMAVWLDWKPEMLREARTRHEFPQQEFRFANMNLDEFAKLTWEEQVSLLQG